MSSLPRGRGPVSESLCSLLATSPDDFNSPLPVRPRNATSSDLHLALYVCYELHYRGFAGVDDSWEWDSRILALRTWLEDMSSTKC